MTELMNDTNLLFTNEEKIILNHIAEESTDKGSCCDQLYFDMEVSEDEDCISILRSVYEKICSLTEEEFSDLQQYIPFDVSISDEDVLLDDEELQNLIEE